MTAAAEPIKGTPLYARVIDGTLSPTIEHGAMVFADGIIVWVGDKRDLYEWYAPHSLTTPGPPFRASASRRA